MKIAVSATGNNLNSELNPRFGRCEYFIIVETDDMSFEAYENENNELSSGAGIQSASFVSSKGAGVVLTGNCGPKAAQTFSAAGVKVLTGFSGTVKNAIEQFKNNENEHQADVPGTNPMSMSQTGRGMGMGGGMGIGGGRCMGGTGRGMGMGGGGRKTGAGMYTSPVPGSKEEDLNSLKEQAELLKQQMETLTNKIKELE